ncbi:major histocompatibility complex class I-related gene protein-like [Chanos chanos]|uniref:Major histocompatibility complex class I-related gene protein-like n=1 Tax=Chanos chanos TaxID=29144 RepID=A0A6J2WP43_CHACN|nr:major histocompatibility complex class I-related gene protein-like [Chanos chanos]
MFRGTKLSSYLCARPLVSWKEERDMLFEHYITLSKPVSAPGIYNFSYMGMIDDTEIESYNSANRIKIPKQDWMRENMTEDYWKSGTVRLRHEEEWMRNEFNKMMTVMGHSQSDVHVLQRRRGCEVERLSDGSVKFLSGSEQYRYDGQDSLSFNLHTEQWEALNNQALSIKERWNSNIPLKQETLGYIKKTCVDAAQQLIQLVHIRNYSKTEVMIFAKRATTPQKPVLICTATGLILNDVTMNIRKNRIQLSDEKLNSTGTRPNGDGTYQLRKSVEIPDSEKADYDSNGHTGDVIEGRNSTNVTEASNLSTEDSNEDITETEAMLQNGVLLKDILYVLLHMFETVQDFYNRFGLIDRGLPMHSGNIKGNKVLSIIAIIISSSEKCSILNLTASSILEDMKI